MSVIYAALDFCMFSLAIYLIFKGHGDISHALFI